MTQGYDGPLPPYYVQSSNPQTPNLGLTLIGVDPIVAYNFVLIDTAVGAGSGVTSLNTLTGAVTLAAGSNITITPSGNTLTFAATGSGTVTSVGLATGAGASDVLYTITGSPVTTSGTITETLRTQTANFVLAGPTSGGAASPTFRALVTADMPSGFGVPASPNNSVQTNNSGAFGGSANLTFASNVLDVIGVADVNDNGAYVSAGTINGISLGAFSGSGAPASTLGTSRLDVASTTTAFEAGTDTYVGQSVGFQVNPSGNFVESFGPFYMGLLVGAMVPSTNTRNISDLYGVSGNVVFAGSGNSNDLVVGGAFIVTKSGSGTFANIRGASGQVGVSGAGTVSSSQGIYAQSIAAAGTVTNNYGVFIDSGGGGGGTVTHNYGLWIADQTTGGGANPDPWAVFSNGGKAYFKGNLLTSGVVGFGTTSTPDTGISRTGAAALAMGTAAAGDFTGTLKLTILNAVTGIQINGAATSANYLRGNGTNFVSSAIQAGDVNTLIAWNNLQNAAGALTLANAGNATTFNQTSAVNWTWANTTAATATVPQSSPIFNINGRYWTGAASAVDSWTIQDVIAPATNGVSLLSFGHSGSTNTAISFASALVDTGSGNYYGNGVFANYSTTSPVNLTGVVGFDPFLTDAIPYGNGDLHTANTSWVYQTGTFTVNANRIFGSAAGITNTYRSDIAAGTDQWVQVTAVVGGNVATQNCGPAVRMSTVAQTFYYLQFANNAFNIGKCIAGSTTTLYTGTAFPVTGDTVRLEVIGTTLIAYKNGVVIAEVTDTSIASGQVGTFSAANATTNGISAWSGANNTADTGISRVAAGVVGIGTGAAAGITGNLQLNTITSYGGTTTVGQGVPSEIITVDLTAQAAAIGATNLTASAPRTGHYRISWSATITTVDGAASVLGGTNGFQVGFTSPTDSVAKLTVAGNSTTSAANTTGTAVGGNISVYAKTGTAITYRYDYTSTTPGQMIYELHLRLEAL